MIDASCATRRTGDTATGEPHPPPTAAAATTVMPTPRADRTLDRTVEHPRGSAVIPFGEDELLAKFDSCVDGLLEPDAAAALKQALLDLESLDDVRGLTRHLNPAS